MDATCCQVQKMNQVGNVLDAGTTVGILSSYWWYHLLTGAAQGSLLLGTIAVMVLRVALLIRQYRNAPQRLRCGICGR